MLQNFLCDKACVYAKLLQSCPTLCDPMDCSPPGSSVCGIFLDKNIGVGWQALLQGMFSTQRLNTCRLSLLHCRQILYALDHWGSLFVIIFPLFKTQLALYCLYIHRMMLKLLRITHNTCNLPLYIYISNPSLTLQPHLFYIQFGHRNFQGSHPSLDTISLDSMCSYLLFQAQLFLPQSQRTQLITV